MEFKSVSDWRAGPGLCRCCLSDGCYKDISNEYFWKGDKEVYADMLLDCFDLTISYQECGPNSNSRLICEVCIQRLRDAFSFKKQVVSSERRFSDYVKALASGEKPDLASFHEVKVELIKGEKAPSEPAEDDDMHNDLFDNLDDDDDDDADNQPLKNFASQLPKVESDTMQDIPAFDEDLIKKEAKVVKRKYTKKATSTSSKKAKPTTDDPEASSSKIKMDKKKGIVALTLPMKTLTHPAQDTCRQARWNSEVILLNTTAYPFRLHKNVIICSYCGESFDDSMLFRQHVSTIHECFNLSVVFSNLQKEQPVKIDLADMRCRLCDDRFDFLYVLIDHLEEHGVFIDKNAKLGVIPYKLDGSWVCLECEESCLTLAHLDKHMILHFCNYICDMCGIGFVTQVESDAHKRQIHANIFDCNECSLNFKCFSDKKQHVNTIHRKFKHVCPIAKCRARFSTYDQKISHMIAVHNHTEKPYRCRQCPMSYKLRGSRSYHVKTVHKTARPFECNKCNKRFQSQALLNSHLIVHSNIKEFICNFCERAFSRKNTLKMHVLTMHLASSDAKFMCQMCGEVFFVESALKLHISSCHADN